MLVFLKVDLMSCSFTLKISTVWYDFHHDNTYICEDLVLSHDLLPSLTTSTTTKATYTTPPCGEKSMLITRVQCDGTRIR